MRSPRVSPAVTKEMAAVIKYLRKLGHAQHVIAARFGINQARVSEIENNKRFPGLPPDGSLPLDPQPKLPF